MISALLKTIRFFDRSILVKLSTVFFICSISIDWGYFIFYNSEDYVLNKTKSDVQKISSNIQSYLPILRDNIKTKNQIFKNFNTVNFDYDIVISKNGNVTYWSDNTLDFVDQELKNSFTEKCISVKNSIYFLKQVQFNYNDDNYRAIFIIIVYKNPKKQHVYSVDAVPQSIHEKEYLKVPIVHNLNFKVVLNKSENAIPITNYYGLHLFYIVKEYDSFSLANNYFSIFMYILIFILLGLSFIVYSINLYRSTYKTQIAVMFCAILLTSKLLLFDFNLLEHIFKTRIFGFIPPDIFLFIKSFMGKYLINNIFINIIVLIFRKRIWLYIKKVFFKKVDFLKYTFIAIGILIMDYLLIKHIGFIKHVCFNLDINIDINYNINFDYPEIIGVITIIISLLNLFFIINIVANTVILFLYHKKAPLNNREYSLYKYLKIICTHLITRYLLVYIIAFISIPLIIFQDYGSKETYIAILSCFSILVYAIFSKAFNTYYTINHKLFLYLSVCFIIFSIFISYLFYSFTNTRINYEVNEIASGLSLDKDFKNDNALHIVSKMMNEDDTINQFLGSSHSIDNIKIWVLEKYLKKFRQDYKIKFYIFDNEHRNLSLFEPISYDSIAFFLHNPKYSTSFEEIYFMKDNLRSHSYWTINYFDNGVLIIKYQAKDIRKNALETNYILDKFVDTKEKSTLQYDYGIFFKGYLVKSSRGFPYEYEFSKEDFYNLKQNLKIYRKGYNHVISEPSPNNYIIITYLNYSLGMFLTTCSFWVVIFSFYILVYNIIDFLFLRNINYKFFSIKIYYFINFVFVLPLLIGIFYNLISQNNSYTDDVLSTHLEKVLERSQEVYLSLYSLKDKTLNNHDFLEILNDIENANNISISIYNPKGYLTHTNLPFSNSRIEPKAYREIIEGKKPYSISKSYFNNIHFNNIYNPIRLNNFSEPIGIASTSFFNLYHEYQRNLIKSFSYFLNTFAFIYILSLLASNLVLNYLNRPLRMISRKLLGTSLEDSTEITGYKVKDEIGSIINSYNTMVKTLRTNKLAIQENQKHIALQEIVQQVAHEVKNPLTPIKLTLQNLKRMLDKPNILERMNDIKQKIDTILTNIDIISNIIENFKEVAKMPLPKHNKINITQILKETVSLYQSNSNISIIVELPQKDCFCISDAELFRRIFNNLIINSIEAVDKPYKAIIKIQMRENQTGKFLISIKDNGRGIPEEYNTQVYMPNFTTKKKGSGIGLSVAQQGIKHAGGNIWHEANSDKGTTFFIEIPLLEQ